MLIPVIRLNLKADKKGGGSYITYDKSIYIVRDENKCWVWGENTLDSNSNIIASVARDDSFQTKANCIKHIEKELYDKAYDEALWQN